MSHESSTRVKGAERREQSDRKVPERAFNTVLKELKPAPERPSRPPLQVRQQVRPITPLKSIAVAARALPSMRPEALSQARASMNVDANRLGQVRAEALNTQDEKLSGRVLDLIVKELAVELGNRGDQRAHHLPTLSLDADGGRGAKPEPVGLAGPGQGQASGQGQGQAQTQLLPQAGAAPGQLSPALKAQAAVELVRRIEVFLKTDRPALALTVAGALSARVEVERTGKGEVALRIQGMKGPPPAEDIARIRDELRSRGLKVSSLSVA